MQVAAISIHLQVADCAKVSLLSQLLKKVSCNPFGFPAIGLSTCQRYEIYYTAPNLAEAGKLLLRWIQESLRCSCITTSYYEGQACFFHLTKVMSGLDSLIMGETHVLNQVKQAYAYAQKEMQLSSEMHYLFQKSLKIAKAVRFATVHHFGKESLEKAVVEIISSHIKKEDPVLLIGNSDINRSIVHCLSQKGYSQLYLISRSHLGAYADMVQGGLPYQAIEKWGEYPAVILATVADEPLIQSMPSICKTKVLIDLSVPSLVGESVVESIELKKYDLKSISTEIQSRLVHLKAMKEEVEKNLVVEVERAMALYYLKQLKKKQLLVRH